MNWKKKGNAFSAHPTIGDNVLARRRGTSNHRGRYWVGTYEAYSGKIGEKTGATQGDNPTGTLTSVTFRIQHDRIGFLIGGGRDDAREYVALVVDNREVLKATGNNQEKMREVIWDVSRYRGRSAKNIFVIE